MRFKKIIRMFQKGNVCVTGLRGCGKDMLMSNVVVRRREPYVSNIIYTKNRENYQPFSLAALDCGENTYKDFLNESIKKYEFPYIMGSDVYVSDAGIYFPSQYCSELNRDYKYFPTYMALSRQVSRNNVHTNVQNLNRCWDKVREQSDTYIRCNWCRVLFGKIVLQEITLYDKYESCVDRIEPCRIKRPLLNKDRQQQADMAIDKYRNQYGSVKRRLLIYWNKSSYDTYYFEKLLAEGERIEKTKK